MTWKLVHTQGVVASPVPATIGDVFRLTPAGSREEEGRLSYLEAEVLRAWRKKDGSATLVLARCTGGEKAPPSEDSEPSEWAPPVGGVFGLVVKGETVTEAELVLRPADGKWVAHTSYPRWSWRWEEAHGTTPARGLRPPVWEHGSWHIAWSGGRWRA